jgi:hypothetical protein
MWQYPPPQHELDTADLRFGGTVRGVLERRGLTFCRRCASSASAWHRTSSCSSRRQAASRGTCASTSPAAVVGVAVVRLGQPAEKFLLQVVRKSRAASPDRRRHDIKYELLWAMASMWVCHRVQKLLHKVLYRHCAPLIRSAPVYAMHMSVSATAMLLRTAGSAAPRSWAAKWGTHALARPSSPRHSFPSAVHACA